MNDLTFGDLKHLANSSEAERLSQATVLGYDGAEDEVIGGVGLVLFSIADWLRAYTATRLLAGEQYWILKKVAQPVRDWFLAEVLDRRVGPVQTNFQIGVAESHGRLYLTWTGLDGFLDIQKRVQLEENLQPPQSTLSLSVPSLWRWQEQLMRFARSRSETNANPATVAAEEVSKAKAESRESGHLRDSTSGDCN